MKIAIVGKGGSGKSTISALFTSYLKQRTDRNILAIDADINIHLPSLVLGYPFPQDKFLSTPSSEHMIKKHLLGGNSIDSLGAFRKTTPPTQKSNIITFNNSDIILNTFSLSQGPLHVMAVGTYTSEGIGASCYHNNLAILENILSHFHEEKDIIVVDMVAGTDAFASSLHAQFDIIIFVVEPTRRSIDVFHQYLELAQSAGVDDSLFAVGNKIFSDDDALFLQEHILNTKLIGYLSHSSYISKHDKVGGILDFSSLEEQNQGIFPSILDTLSQNLVDPNVRLQRLYELHKKYVSQPFVQDKFGDLIKQIDWEFRF